MASIVENYFYTDRSVTRASREFSPRSEDVILATNPRTGDKAVLRIIRLLNTRDEEEFDQVARVVNSDSVPWIESRFVDGDPELLNAEQPGTRRIFKTHMAAQGLNVKGKKKCPLFVTIARHPVDVRVSWYNYIRDCYRVGGNDARTNFEATFQPDDFVDVTATTAQINPLAKILTLEHIMVDWYLESKKNRRVFQVFYEQLVTDPTRVIKELADFLETKPTSERIGKIAALVIKEPYGTCVGMQAFGMGIGYCFGKEVRYGFPFKYMSKTSRPHPEPLGTSMCTSERSYSWGGSHASRISLLRDKSVACVAILNSPSLGVYPTRAHYIGHNMSAILRDVFR